MCGPALLLAGIVLFALLDANSKLLSGTYGLGQVIAVRYAVLIALLLLVRTAWRGAGGRIATARPFLNALRAGSMMATAALFFLAFQRLPLALGYLVFFTSPFMTLALSALVLRERVPAAAWAWCLAGFGGVVLAVLPRLDGGGSEAEAPGLAAMLAGTFFFAVTQTVNRSLRGETGSARILFWPSLLGLLLYGPFALQNWVAPPPRDLLMLAANGIIAGTAVACTAAAYRHADAARLGPWAFAALPVSFLLDLVLWDHRPDAAMLAGAAAVVVACVMSERASRPRRLRRWHEWRDSIGRQGIPGGKRWVPSALKGSGAAERTAESGKAP
jgi:drug/metabolite transporter (DMT)-like permease